MRAVSDNFSTTITPFPTLDANGMEDGPFEMTLAYAYEKSQYSESFFEPLNLQKGRVFSTLKQSFPGDEEKLRARTIGQKQFKTNSKDLKLIYLRTMYYYLQIFRKIVSNLVNMHLVLIHFFFIAHLVSKGNLE